MVQRLAICLGILLIVLICQISSTVTLKQTIFAESPSFIRQEVIDQEKDIFDTFTGRRDRNGPDYIDIESVTYFSDGKFLNATLWPVSFNNMPLDRVFYGVLVDADLNSNTGYQGIDYKVEIAWNRTAQNWTKSFVEWSSGLNEKFLEGLLNITGFFGKKEQESYVSLDVNLRQMLYPERYRLFFYAYASPAIDPSSGERIGPAIMDIVRGVYIPTPTQEPLILASIAPPNANLPPGEQRTVPLQVNSTIGLYTSLQLPQDFVQRNIKLHFHHDVLGLPPNSVTTIPVDIKVPSNTVTGQHTLSIPANVSLPDEDFDIATTPKKEHITIESMVLQSELSFVVSIGKASNIFEVNIPTDTLLSILLVVITAIIGWFIPSIAR